MEICLVESNFIFALDWRKKASCRKLAVHLKSFNPFQREWIKSHIGFDSFDLIDPSTSDFQYYAGPLAHRELLRFKNSQWLAQNRLFKSLPFKVNENFTAFRKQAETHLPDYFSDVITLEKGVIKEQLDSYFRSSSPSLYFETRNSLMGKENRTDFSTLLSIGAVDVRELWNRVSDYERDVTKNKSTYWIKFELLWREFFFWHYQKWGRQYFSLNGLKGPLDFTPFPKYSLEDIKKIAKSDVIFACLNELENTGYMTNRTRQWFASYWMNDLSLDWRSGADLFERYLVDYDVFSNWGNWMYLAGVGVDPRGKRYFNLDKQMQMYDPHSNYLKRWYY